MKTLVSKVERKNFQSYHQEQYLLFEIKVFQDSEIILEESFFAKKDDILFNDLKMIISLSNVQENSIKIELFDGTLYTEEEILDKLSSHTFMDLDEQGNMKKIVIKYRRNY